MGTVVYFAQLGTCVKIGYATNLSRRMANMSLPKSAVIGTLPGGPSLEAELHERFARSRIEGSEWFTITPEIEEFIDSLGGMQQVLAPPQPPQPKPTREEIPRCMVQTVPETAILLGITEHEVWQLLAEKTLLPIRLGDNNDLVRILRSDIDELAEQ